MVWKFSAFKFPKNSTNSCGHIPDSLEIFFITEFIEEYQIDKHMHMLEKQLRSNKIYNVSSINIVSICCLPTEWVWVTDFDFSYFTLKSKSLAIFRVRSGLTHTQKRETVIDHSQFMNAPLQKMRWKNKIISISSI